MKATFLVVALSVFSFSAFAQNTPVTIEKKAPLPVQQVKPIDVQKINLNTADARTLTGSFKGIGQKRAEAIVHYREAHEGFKSVAELAAVRGIGQSFVDHHLQELEQVFAID